MSLSITDSRCFSLYIRFNIDKSNERSDKSNKRTTRMADTSEFQRLLAKGSSLTGFMSKNYTAFVGIVLGIVVFTIIVVCFLREYCMRKWGIEVCPGAVRRRRDRLSREERLRMAQDEQLAVQVQQEFEGEKKRRIQHRRDERRKKYEVFLKPYTMVSQPTCVFALSRLSGDIRSSMFLLCYYRLSRKTTFYTQIVKKIRR